jgi:hypothetical protein
MVREAPGETPPPNVVLVAPIAKAETPETPKPARPAPGILSLLRQIGRLALRASER